VLFVVLTADSILSKSLLSNRLFAGSYFDLTI
jgi:hypothetical protein